MPTGFARMIQVIVMTHQLPIDMDKQSDSDVFNQRSVKLVRLEVESIVSSA